MLLGIDVSTTGAKALLVNERGEVLATATEEYPLYTPYPLWSEQNPEDWWHGVQRAVQRVLATPGVRAEDISGVGLTGQMHGLVLLGRPFSGTISVQARNAPRSRGWREVSTVCLP
jgi:xylulokinase